MEMHSASVTIGPHGVLVWLRGVRLRWLRWLRADGRCSCLDDDSSQACLRATHSTHFREADTNTCTCAQTHTSQPCS